MKVLLSIKPEYAEKILKGEKRFEFRKVVFKNPSVRTVVIYATMPVGKVIGEFDIDEIISASPNEIWNLTDQYSGITKRFFTEYFDGREIAHAIKIKKTKRYDEPIDLLKILPHGIAPQSFCYLN